VSATTTLPTAVEDYLRSTLIDCAHPLLLSFNANWELRDLQGDAAFYGIDLGDHARGARELQDLFIGLPLDDSQDIPFVELASGRCAHVHLVADGAVLHVLLLDAEREHGRRRAQQQMGNEALLASHQKSKAIGKLREIRSELERQRARLEEADALKNALIATLSHDFRTPLTSIFGYLHLLEHHVGDDTNSPQAVQAIRRNATYLFTLAENLLEYGRGESAAALLIPVEVDLAALAADIDAMFRPLAEDKDLAFHVDLALDDATAPLFDDTRLRQVVINLLSNAVRYTTSGEIALCIEWRAGVLRIRVRDSGIGISSEYRDSVFKPFNRGGQAGSKGAGLGLSIVQRLVTQMHGSLELDSKPGQGSCFSIELPSLGRAAQTSSEHNAAASPGVGRSVLVVDDDPDIAQLLEVLLTEAGFRVQVVGSAAAALAEAPRVLPDVLLIDVELPDLSGNAVVFQLRARGYGGRIVTLSATATTDARDASLRAGADFYLTKPLNIDQFVNVMQRAVSVSPPG
jgi:signal transduction histidine kinase/ActR/RegA family two-component response regulator